MKMNKQDFYNCQMLKGLSNKTFTKIKERKETVSGINSEPRTHKKKSSFSQVRAVLSH